MRDKMENYKTTLKVSAIIIIIVLMTLPQKFINNTINERKERKTTAMVEAAEGWGGEQKIGSPVLYVPIAVESKSKEQNDSSKAVQKLGITSYLRILPETFVVSCKSIPEIRYRSIFDFVFYRANLNVTGKFVINEDQFYNIGNGILLWDEANVAVGVSSIKGLSEKIKIKFGNETYDLDKLSERKDIFDSAFESKVNITRGGGTEISYSYDLSLQGSGGLYFLPMGKTTSVKMDSTWPAPNFTGSLLPAARNISEVGFDAEWKTADFNRKFPQFWSGSIDRSHIEISAFGVILSNTVDDYFKIHRSVKYILIFISLTFFMFFLAEIIMKKRIHPIQYLFVGASLAVFYVLLLSISEHIGFTSAYLISVAANIAMTGLYSVSVLKSSKFGLIVSAIYVILYTYLYIVIINQDYSLLLGSVGLFLILAVSMFLTRNIDWYNLYVKKCKEEDQKEA
jgi:inner membrane protein